VTGLCIALAVVALVLGVCGVRCGLAARGATARAEQAEVRAEVAEEDLALERSVVLVQRREITELTHRLIDAGAGGRTDEDRLDIYGLWEAEQ
jgi:hypothetical protein